MNTDLGSFPICKVSANRGQNKINLFIFYVEVHPNFTELKRCKSTQHISNNKITTKKDSLAIALYQLRKHRFNRVNNLGKID